jgi:hypothetical protein
MSCVDALDGFRFSDLIDRPADKGRSEGLDGTAVTWVEASLTVPAAVDVLIQMAEDEACEAQLRAVGPPSAAQLEAHESVIEESVREATSSLPWTIGGCCGRFLSKRPPTA